MRHYDKAKLWAEMPICKRKCKLIVKGEMLMNYLFGFGFPFAVVLLLILFLRGKKSEPVVYDEMQTAVRGTAYKYSTITGVLSGFIAAFLVDQDLLPVDGCFAMMSVCLLMIAVYTVYMVMKGVYFGISSHWKKWTALILVIGLCNMITAVLRICEDGLPEKKLTIINIPVMTGAVFIIIAAAVLIQKAREKRSEDS